MYRCTGWIYYKYVTFDWRALVEYGSEAGPKK